jgi:hypothetical protein
MDPDPIPPVEITIPAYAADTLGESITVLAPKSWHDTIRALAPHTVYGPDYLRAVVYSLERMSDIVEDGHTATAYDWLRNAQDLAAHRGARQAPGALTRSTPVHRDEGPL